jgi:predicted nuclease of predicted toxin-antitoxin system
MSILVDHCVPHLFVRRLHEWGYSATPLRTHLAPDAEDPDVIALAQQLDAILLTVDMDFANILNYPPQNFQGIIVARYEAHREKAVLNTLQQALQDLYRERLRGVLVIVTANRYRIRQSQS